MRDPAQPISIDATASDAMADYVWRQFHVHRMDTKKIADVLKIPEHQVERVINRKMDEQVLRDAIAERHNAG